MKDILTIIFYFQKYLWFENKDEYNITKKKFKLNRTIGFLLNILLILIMGYMSIKAIPLAITVKKQKKIISELETKSHDNELLVNFYKSLYEMELRNRDNKK